VSIEAVIFDCDGTLVDSEPLGNEVLVEYVAELGLRIPIEEALVVFRGRKMGDCLDEIARRLGRPLPGGFEVELRRRMSAAFRERLQPIDGADDLLRAMTVPFCVATNGPREKMTLTLSVTGLIEHCGDRLFSAYEVGAWKPDPGLFTHAAEAMGVEPRSCAVVDDSDHGIQAALACGMEVFAFLPDDGDRSPPGPVHVIRHLSELPAALNPDSS
jgi:HAD superfamily hydrolase (TIGR01509 family)